MDAVGGSYGRVCCLRSGGCRAVGVGGRPQVFGESLVSGHVRERRFAPPRPGPGEFWVGALLFFFPLAVRAASDGGGRRGGFAVAEAACGCYGRHAVPGRRLAGGPGRGGPFAGRIAGFRLGGRRSPGRSPFSDGGAQFFLLPWLFAGRARQGRLSGRFRRGGDGWLLRRRIWNLQGGGWSAVASGVRGRSRFSMSRLRPGASASGVSFPPGRVRASSWSMARSWCRSCGRRPAGAAAGVVSPWWRRPVVATGGMRSPGRRATGGRGRGVPFAGRVAGFRLGGGRPPAVRFSSGDVRRFLADRLRPDMSANDAGMGGP